VRYVTTLWFHHRPYGSQDNAKLHKIELQKILIFQNALNLLSVAIPLWVYNLVEKVVPLTKNGFFCGDLSIHYPYRNSSISSTVMFISGCGMLLLSVSLL